MTDSSLKWALSWWFSMEPSLHHFLSHLTWILLLASCNPQAWCYCNSPSFHVPLLSLKRSHRQTNMTVNFIGDKLVSHFFHLRIHQTTVSFSLSLSLWHGVYLIPTCYVYVYIYMYTYIYIILHLYLYLYLYIYNMYVYIYVCITCIFCVPIRFGAQWKIASENLSPGLSECLSLPRCMVRTTRTRRQGAVVLAQEVYDIGGCFHPNLSYLVYIYILYVFMADFPYPFVLFTGGYK